jgi:drug/metabolite transporter (DMT)-like permease
LCYKKKFINLSKNYYFLTGECTNGHLEMVRQTVTLRPSIGIVLVLISGLAFSVCILMAIMARKNGVDLNTSNIARYFVASVIIFVYQKINGLPIIIPTRERIASLALGITVFMMGIGYLGATRYIPVSLAVLIFYTGPFFVFIIARFTEKEPFTMIRLSAFLIASSGLYLAMGIKTLSGLHFTGILFAFIAAIGMALWVIIGNLLIRTADPQAVNLHALSSGTLLFFCFYFLTNDAGNQLTQTSLLYLIASGITLGIAFISFYAGLKIIGSVKASMLLNIEPIFTIALSVAIFGAQLSLTSYFGAGLVILGIFLINYKSKSNLKTS